MPVVAATKESAGSEGGNKMAKDKKEIATRVRSLGAHRRWLNQYASNYTVKITLYKNLKTKEASDEAFQIREKIMERQEKMLDILQELRELDEEEAATYTKQESEVEKQVEALRTLMEAATKEVNADLRANVGATPPASGMTGPPPVRKLEVRLTEFRRDAAEQWFEETERALRVANVTDDVEKIVCIQKYVPENIREAKRSLFNGGSYQAVKDAVIKAVEKTEEEKFKAFLAMQLGDRKPSEAWADLTKLMPENAQDFQDLVMKQKFLAMVGTDLAQHLTDDKLTLASGLHTEEIEKYVQKVDKLFGSKKPRAAVNSVKKEADSKEAGVSEVRNGRDSGKSQQKGNRRRKDSRSSSRKRDNGWSEQMCRIHRRFGNKAWSCDKPDACPLAKLIAKKPEKK